MKLKLRIIFGWALSIASESFWSFTDSDLIVYTNSVIFWACLLVATHLSVIVAWWNGHYSQLVNINVFLLLYFLGKVKQITISLNSTQPFVIRCLIMKSRAYTNFIVYLKLNGFWLLQFGSCTLTLSKFMPEKKSILHCSCWFSSYTINNNNKNSLLSTIVLS